MIDSHLENILPIPVVFGQTHADKILYCLVRAYPNDKHKSAIYKECKAIEGSVNLATVRLVQNNVITRTGPGRCKVKALHRYKQAHHGAEILFKMFEKGGITPPDELLQPRPETHEIPAPSQNGNAQSILPDEEQPFVLPPPSPTEFTKYKRQQSEGEKRLTQFVANFVHSIRTKIERFEEDLASLDY